MSRPDAPGFDRLRKGLVGSLLVVVVLLVSLLYLGEEGWVVLGAMLLGLMAYALVHILFGQVLQGTRRNVVRPDPLADTQAVCAVALLVAIGWIWWQVDRRETLQDVVVCVEEGWRNGDFEPVRTTAAQATQSCVSEALDSPND